MSDTLDRAAFYQSFNIANPAAGAEFTLTVPTGLAYKFETIYFQLVTSAVVASRFVELQITDASNNILWQGGGPPTGSGMAASSTMRASGWRLGAQAASFTNGAPYMFSLPDVWIPAGYILKTVTLNKDVGDQYSLINGLVRVSTVGV